MTSICSEGKRTNGINIDANPGFSRVYMTAQGVTFWDQARCIWREMTKDTFGCDGEIEMLTPKPNGTGYGNSQKRTCPVGCRLLGTTTRTEADP
jgi:hypothetical protein